MSSLSANCSVVAVAVLFLLCSALRIECEQLSVDYYQKTCPQVENIVRAEMIRKQAANPTTAAGTLRLFFHDCFVEGCDASVLISSTPDNKAEKDAEINLSLPGDGFDAIARAKTAIEAKCPGIVSCADILSMATRDLISLIGGPYYPVKKGRKDGRISKSWRVAGAHTVGFTHCKEFLHRIYTYNRTTHIDPTMNFQYAMGLRKACPRANLDPTIVVFNDVNSPKTFDNGFYRNLPQGLGLLASDQILYTDPRSRVLAQRYASDQATFFNAFVAAMDKLGSVGVKTGTQGDVRRRCDAFN